MTMWSPNRAGRCPPQTAGRPPNPNPSRMRTRALHHCTPPPAACLALPCPGLQCNNKAVSVSSSRRTLPAPGPAAARASPPSTSLPVSAPPACPPAWHSAGRRLQAHMLLAATRLTCPTCLPNLHPNCAQHAHPPTQSIPRPWPAPLAAQAPTASWTAACAPTPSSALPRT